jgi:rare lipoprotein A
MGANPGAWCLPLVVAIGFLLAGCGSSGPQLEAGHGKSRGYYKVGAPYQVNGVWYSPRVDYAYDRTGIASWYGEAFHGKPTANGEVFNLNQVSAAHKTLQLPSIVEVTNLKNGRALQMRVNDRGPFVGDRIIDLSRRAAQLLGFEGAGTAPVRVRIMREESVQVAEAAMRGSVVPVMVAQARRTAPMQMAAATSAAASPPPTPAPPAPAPIVQAAAAPAAASPRRSWPMLIASAHAETVPAAATGPRAGPGRHTGRIFVQAGAFAVPENAQRVRARVAGLGSAEVLRATVNGAAMYRVRVGPVASAADAQRLLSRIVDSGYPGARVVDE